MSQVMDWRFSVDVGYAANVTCKQAGCSVKMDILGFEPRAFRMQSGCDATTPYAQLHISFTAMKRRSSTSTCTRRHTQRSSGKVSKSASIKLSGLGTEECFKQALTAVH